MDIEKHISNLKQYIKDDEIIEKDGSDFANFCKGHIDDIQAVLNELEKKDKVIDKMAMYLADIDFDECCAEIPEHCLSCSWEDYEPHTNCIKEYFYKKVE